MEMPTIQRIGEVAHEFDRIPDRLAIQDRARAGDEHAHCGEREHRGRQRDRLADDLLALAAAESA
jgi:hypothetical protein